MTTFIALLRGINVGGHNKIKMADLKQLLESLGLMNVETYIQSGNVLFEANQDESSLQRLLEEEIKKAFGLTVTVVLRTGKEFLQVANHCPFTEAEIRSAQAAAAGECLHVAFLLKQPTAEGVELLKPYENDAEQYHIAGREVYLLYHDSIRNAKLGSQLHKLGTPATVRNWKTVLKLTSMIESRDVR